MKKLYKCFKNNVKVKFILHCQSAKLLYLRNTKDKTPLLSQSSVFYKFNFPFCNASYIGKAEHSLWEKAKEHAYSNGTKTDQNAVYQYLSSYEHYNHLVDLFRLQNDILNLKKLNVQQIRDNTTIINRAENGNISLFKEGYIIKTHT